MYALLLTWDLTGHPPSMIEEDLRRYIADSSWDRYGDVPELRLKTWFSDTSTMTWGAFYLWESEAAREKEIESMHRVRAMTGVEPTVRRFTVEAAQEGRHGAVRLGDVGAAAPGR